MSNRANVLGDVLLTACRAAYVASYISIEDHKKSFVRSSLWAVGAGLTFYQIYKAAVLLG